MKKVFVNNTSCVEMELTVSSSAESGLISSANPNPVSWNFVALLAILGGHKVKVHAFSGTNIAGHTNEKQIVECFNAMPEGLSKDRAKIELDRVIERFGNGTLGFHMSGSLCKEFPKDIQEMIDKIL